MRREYPDQPVVAVGVAVHTLAGVGVGVPVSIIWAMAANASAVIVASFCGVGVAVTTTGVTQFMGRGVGVPTVVAQASLKPVARSARRGIHNVPHRIAEHRIATSHRRSRPCLNGLSLALGDLHRGDAGNEAGDPRTASV